MCLCARINHPNVLRVLDTFEETKKFIAFVTEPVLCSLSNAFSRFGNLPEKNALPTEALQLGQCEVLCGLMSMCEALEFLHDTVGTAHLNLCPEVIFLAASTGTNKYHRTWKLAGFGHSLPLTKGSSLDISPYFVQSPTGGPQPAANRRKSLLSR